MQYDRSMCGAGGERVCIMSTHEYLIMWVDTNSTHLLIDQDSLTLTRPVY